MAQLASGEIEPFRDEALTIAHFRHPHIVRVLDFGTEDDIPFLVMDYAPNGILRQRYPSGTILTPTSILPSVQQGARAYNFCGSPYLALKQSTQAFADFDQAIALKPYYSVASRNRSLAYSVLVPRHHLPQV